MELRIHKYLSECGVLSRRAAEQAIKDGRVKINGRKAEIGAKIFPGRDHVTYNGVPVRRQGGGKDYFLLNKPLGVVTTMSDEHDRPCVGEIIKKIGASVYPVGRLDMYTEGLLILTNDGDVANKLMHPSARVPKVYHLRIRGEASAELLERLRAPIEIDGKKTTSADVALISADEKCTKLRVSICEGRNRQVRKMCEEAGAELLRLKRISIGELNIGTLKPGEWKRLTYGQVKYLKGL